MTCELVIFLSLFVVCCQIQIAVFYLPKPLHGFFP